MKVSQLRAQQRTVYVEIPDEEEKVRVDYKPGALTLEVSEQIKDQMQTGFEFEIGGTLLENIVVDWDLQNEDGSPLPCNKEEIKKIPFQFLGLLLGAIYEDLQPDPQKGAPSNDSSPPRDEPGSLQTGT